MYRSPNIVRVIKSRRLRCAGRSAFKILRGKPAGKKPLGRPRRRWEDNLRMDLKYVSIRRIELILLNIGIIGEPL